MMHFEKMYGFSILTGEIKKNTVDSSIIIQTSFQVGSHVFELTMNNVIFEENYSEDFNIYIGNPNECKINVSGGSYSENRKGVMYFYCTKVNEESLISGASFYGNVVTGSGADITLTHKSGQLAISS